ncbi:MAG: hypothetical protein ACI9XZ_000418 [Alphaproteobacteria bacterium]|jgi:hypothetical protein
MNKGSPPNRPIINLRAEGYTRLSQGQLINLSVANGLDNLRLSLFTAVELLAVAATLSREHVEVEVIAMRFIGFRTECRAENPASGLVD